MKITQIYIVDYLQFKILIIDCFLINSFHEIILKHLMTFEFC